MTNEDALRRYRRNQFTDQDVARCTGLSERKWQELIKNKLVRTVMHTPGRGRVRLCDRTTLKRAAVIAALNQVRLSLSVSSAVAYFLPFHTALYELCDPDLLRRAASGELPTEIPPRRAKLNLHWFDPAQPAQADLDSDWNVQIYEGRFVGVTYGPKHGPLLFGDLRDNCSRFVAWVPSHRRDQFVGCAIEKLARELGRKNLAEAVAAWEEPTRWSRDLNSLGYRFEQHAEDDVLHTTAAAAAKGPLFSAMVNVSLAIRKALRRYLDIEPAERQWT